MKNSRQRDFSNTIKDICWAIEYSIANNTRCIIPYTIYSKWPPELPPTLATAGLIRKEKSKIIKEISCTCENGELLTIEYKKDSQPFIQCFDCGAIRDVIPSELEYYESAPLYIAKFLTTCIGDIDKPKPIIKDRVFFVGETSKSVLVYIACGLKSENQKGILDKCSDDAKGAAFIIAASYSPETIAKQYTLIPAYENKLYTLTNNNMSLDVEFIESHFAKNSQKQEAAFAKHIADPRSQQKQHLQKHIISNIESWTLLNHEEIHQKICDSPALYEYETNKGEVKKLSDKTILQVIKDILVARGQRFRITGIPEYNSDRHTWYNS